MFLEKGGSKLVYISKIEIEGYKNCKEKSTIEFSKGLNIIIGENATGKTTIIDAIRLILRESETSMYISENDFYHSFANKETASKIRIDLYLQDLSPDEEVTFLSWCDADFNAVLHLEVDNKASKMGRYKRTIWGGASKLSVFEEETFDCIDCIYLPPLRDAEERLTSGKKSRLAILLGHQYTNEEDKYNLEEKVKNANESLAKEKEIEKAKNDINCYMRDSIGNVFGQTINLQFSDISFLSILRNIKMMFFPEVKDDISVTDFFDIAINCLGYNNLLYIYTILAELDAPGREQNLFTVLLIEEPEAHLHPQLQIKLIKYLEQLVMKKENMQIIITTHSAVLASSVNIDRLIHLNKSYGRINATLLSKLEIEKASKNYINRWLDVTKSTLLFSKGVIFVEGISEAILLPELAKIVLAKYNDLNSNKLPSSLEEAGVSVININGINFKHFFQLFCDINGKDMSIRLPIRCSGITDLDPEKITVEDHTKNGKVFYKRVESFPDSNVNIKSTNKAIELIATVNKSVFVRLYSSTLKTFEYDLAMRGNIKLMAQTLYDIWPAEGNKTGVKSKCQEIIESCNEQNKYDNSKYIYEHINDELKGVFSQTLADKLKELYDKNEDTSYFLVPKYIENAVIWACGGDVSE
jgi:putative ATP-dependent endonuclease of OLD family